MTERRRLPAPWKIIEHKESFEVQDAAKVRIAFVYFEDDTTRRHMQNYLDRDEARRIARAIARLPELLGKGQE